MLKNQKQTLQIRKANVFPDLLETCCTVCNRTAFSACAFRGGETVMPNCLEALTETPSMSASNVLDC